MARRNRSAAELEADERRKIQDKSYSAALYARISVEDERKRESNSIGNQLQLLKDFASENADIKVYDIYVDDDISGTDFNRPEYSRMMNDLRNKKINCIIVKDLSRLGRNYLESGEYIEMVFPFFECRFIAINDRFDSKYQQADISVQIKNLINEMYAKDISKKICSSFQSIQMQGKYTGSKAPYGYLLNPRDKHHLIPDPETAPIVREIFEMIAVKNCTIHFVSINLTARGIPSPGRLLYERGMVKTDQYKKSKWYGETVRKILRNPIYIGCTVSGKTRSTYHENGIKGARPVPKEDWIITRGTHEPIIEEKIYDQVQAYLDTNQKEKANNTRYNSKSKGASIFKGHLICGECGRAMYLRHKKNHANEKTWWYYCALHENYNSSYCVKKAVKKADVESIALKLIKTQIKLFTEADELIKELNAKESSKTKYKIYLDQIQNTKKQLDDLIAKKATLYDEYANNLLTKSEYVCVGQEYARKADELRIFISELEKEAQKYSPTYLSKGGWARIIAKYKNATKLTEEMVDAFIDKMILYNDGHVEITFKCKNEIDQMMYLANIRKKEAERYVV